MVTKSLKNKAAKKGYRLQVSQHAPEGYKGAYSLQCFTDVAGKENRDFDLGDTEAEARKNLNLVVKNL